MRAAIICRDKAGALSVRQENRPMHLEYLRSTGVVEQAGPFLDENGGMCGSLLILNVGTLAEAQAWAAADPYAKAGLFESVTVIEWNRVIGG
ncbi:MAG: YciI family protein [Paracoccaceae bacterium]|nr:YciI family protein [Paracoccaceae bacterium]